ncbi:low temperature requirement protein A [Solihabitans fulvus]|uniref:Low temperature requirement protein A n=2 Tax=Solihabitans fulvus TaxID=1892852 RepID=A0A5B2XCK3_9PSEU|nr:low temperature requirement protein A [Solihabitans fulvus]
MRARNADEEHRAATPLELFFDLCFVVAVSLAGAGLHHALTENHVAHGVLGYVMVFFAIWWAWMNFTWFASAYDTDDGLYRLTTMVQIVGALVLAAGVPRALDRTDFSVITAGYVIMRLAMVAQWLRAAHADPEHRPTTLRYAAGVAIVQVGWVARLALPGAWGIVGFVVLALADVAVPIYAERFSVTPWHPSHIAERYGLFTVIVLGESILAATTAMRSALDSGEGGAALLSLAAAGVVIVFSMWWLYFDRSASDLLTSLRASLVWGYGHLVIFASAAAVGAGLEVAIDYDTNATHLSALAAGWAVTVPVALYLLSVWALHIRACASERGPMVASAFPVTAVLVLATPFTHAPVHVTAVLMAGLVLLTQVAGRRATA